MNMLDIALTIVWSTRLQQYVGTVRIHDEDLTYAEKVVTGHDPLHIQMIANNLWMRTSFDIIEQQYPQAFKREGKDGKVHEQLSLFD